MGPSLSHAATAPSASKDSDRLGCGRRTAECGRPRCRADTRRRRAIHSFHQHVGAPAYTQEEAAAAHQKLCDTYRLAARSVDIDTNTDNRALADAVSANAAVMLQQAVSSSPAMPPGDRVAALALAAAYTKATAMGSALWRDDPVFRSEIDDVNAKDAVMKKICSGG